MTNKYTTFCLLPLLLLLTLNAVGNNDKNTLGAKSGAMGGTSVANADVFSVFANQAALARINALSAAIYGESRYLIPDLNLYGLGVAIPTSAKGGTFGIGLNYFGNALYNEKQLRLGYGRVLFEKLAVGIELDALSVSMSDYGNKTAVTFGIGLLYTFNEMLSVGAHIYNPTRQQITANQSDKLPTVMKFGLAYTPSSKATIAVETEKNLDRPFMIKAGIEYRVIDKLYLRGGISTNPALSSFGVGLNLGVLKIDIAGSIHPDLGYTPMVSIAYVGRKASAKPAENK